MTGVRAPGAQAGRRDDSDDRPRHPGDKPRHSPPPLSPSYLASRTKDHSLLTPYKSVLWPRQDQKGPFLAEESAARAAFVREALPLYRSSEVTGVREFHAVGHDRAASALANAQQELEDMGDSDDVDGRAGAPEAAPGAEIDLTGRTPEDEPITVVYGGANDGRHFLATLR
jgi:hypothetical protein